MKLAIKHDEGVLVLEVSYENNVVSFYLWRLIFVAFVCILVLIDLIIMVLLILGYKEI